ncbi:MAG: DNA-binding domain-containing protein [Rhodomicrobium sp.]
MRASADSDGLLELQAGFARALLERGEAAPRGLIRSTRFGVYRNNVFASLTAVLRSRYPVIERLVGEEFFKAAAGLFIAAHPPSTPVLIEYGERFPAFLESFDPARGVPYLADVARLEWLRHTAFHAADRKPLTAQSLAPVPPEEAATLTFKLHPSVGLIASPYPIVSVWETNAYDAEVRAIGPGFPGEAALAVRPELEVTVLRLDPAEYAFTAALEGGANLGDAAAIASALDSFSLAQALSKLIAAGAFAGFTSQKGDLHHA